MRVAVTGAAGQMGGTVADLAVERGWSVPVAVDADHGGEVAGTTVAPPDDLGDRLAAESPDALVDFSVPAATREAVPAAAAAGVPAVVGTTGFDEDGLAVLREAAETVPVLKATNFSRGVQALLAALEPAVAALPGYDLEVTETHHSRKRDAPSGTANTILEHLEAVRPDAGERVHGREGIQPREAGEVGVHARRAGDVRGEHEVMIAGNDEVLEFTHRAESRRVFAAGALDAAEWVAGPEREPGYYSFAEVIADT